MYKLRYNARLGMFWLGLLIAFLGVNMYLTGHQFFAPYFHAYRKWLLPELKNRITPTLTFDDCAWFVVRMHSIIMFVCGLLIMRGNRVLGPAMLIFEMEFMIVALDNPFIIDYLKPKPKNTRYRYDLLFKHISMVGLAILIMCSPPAKTAEEEEEEVKQ